MSRFLITYLLLSEVSGFENPGFTSYQLFVLDKLPIVLLCWKTLTNRCVVFTVVRSRTRVSVFKECVIFWLFYWSDFQKHKLYIIPYIDLWDYLLSKLETQNSSLNPYFPFTNVLNGILQILSRIYFHIGFYILVLTAILSDQALSNSDPDNYQSNLIGFSNPVSHSHIYNTSSTNNKTSL